MLSVKYKSLMLSVVKLGVIMLSVVMLNVIMLSVVAALKESLFFRLMLRQRILIIQS